MTVNLLINIILQFLLTNNYKNDLITTKEDSKKGFGRESNKLVTRYPRIVGENYKIITEINEKKIKIKR